MDVSRSSFKIFLAESLGMVLSLGGITYFARELGSGELGAFFLFQALLFFLAVPSDMGVRIAVEKRISERSNPDSVLSTALLMKLGLLSLTVTGVFLAGGLVRSYIGYDLVAFLAVGIVLQELSGLMKNVLAGELRVGETASIDFANTLTKYGVGAVLVYAGYGVVGLAASVLAGLFVRLVLAYRACDTGFGRPRKDVMRSLGNYGKYAILPHIGRQVHQWMDVLLLGFMLTTSAVSVYELAWRVAGPVLLLSRSIGTAIFPQFSSWDSAGSREAIERLFSNIITPSLLLVFPALFGAAVLSREILSLVFGAEYAAGWLVLIVLMAGKIPGAVQSIVGRSLYGLDEPQYVTIGTTVTIATNLVFNVLLIWQFGVVGAALGTMASRTISTGLQFYFLSELIDVRIPYDELGWCLGASAVMAAVLSAVKTTVAVDSVVRLTGFVLAGAALYGAFVAMYPPLKNQITTQIQKSVPWT
ncbi:oligosaccharide flippase family protein [Halorussus ruber]|uniref:oligosaccharide flippase family protein n=1 Tax=Halorussus ruber TaxID=1126238 RepID=UPI0010919873|nr:polysaccharide biosynthesis C-terminal domain-containing protein [Halorussus ruber]